MAAEVVRYEKSVCPRQAPRPKWVRLAQICSPPSSPAHLDLDQDPDLYRLVGDITTTGWKQRLDPDPDLPFRSSAWIRRLSSPQEAGDWGRNQGSLMVVGRGSGREGTAAMRSLPWGDQMRRRLLSAIGAAPRGSWGA